MATKQNRKVAFDLASARAQAKADAAELLASDADAVAGSAQARLYDTFSQREISNATALEHFRRRVPARGRKTYTVEGPKSTSPVAKAIRAADAAEALAEKVREDARRLQALADAPSTVVPKSAEVIRQGVKAPVETVPMPVRLEVDQVRMLKLLASYEQTTASAIIRASIKERLEQARKGNPGFDAAVRSSLEK